MSTTSLSRPPRGAQAATSRSILLMSLVAGVAFTARLVPVLRGGGLRGLHEYDDGVYFSAATSLLHGLAPYRDFLLLHPPGILLALSPFALLGRLTSDSDGLATARVAFAMLGALSAALTTRILLRRFGTAAAVVGGTFYAVAFPGVNGERTAVLEPLGNLALVTALGLLDPAAPGAYRRWTPYLAGAVLGLSAAVKIWGVVPLLVVALWQVRPGAPATARRVLVGAAASAAVVCLPFFVRAPGAMVRMVILDQLHRPSSVLSAPERLRLVLGPYSLGPDASVPQPPWPLSLPVLAVAALGILLAVRHAVARLDAVLFLAMTTMLIVTPSFFVQYAAILVPPAALVAGAAAATVLRWVPGRRGRGLAAAVLVGSTAAYFSPGLHTPTGKPFSSAGISSALQGLPGCVVADSPVALVQLDVLNRDLDRGCPTWVDVTGLTYDRDAAFTPDGHGVPRSRNAAWQSDLLRYLRSGAAAILVRQAPDGLSAGTRAAIAGWPVLARSPLDVVSSPR